MRHKWGKRSWWRELLARVIGTTQTCQRCGAKLRVVKPAKLLPGRRRPARTVTRWYKGLGSEMSWQVERVPPCELVIEALKKVLQRAVTSGVHEIPGCSIGLEESLTRRIG